jgi:hypothetical protein
VANCFARDQSSAFVESSQFKNKYVKGMETTRRRYQAYRLPIQSEYVKGMEMDRLRYQAYRLRIGCVSKRNPRCVVEAHDRQTDFGLTMTVV